MTNTFIYMAPRPVMSISHCKSDVPLKESILLKMMPLWVFLLMSKLSLIYTVWELARYLFMCHNNHSTTYFNTAPVMKRP